MVPADNVAGGGSVAEEIQRGDHIALSTAVLEKEVKAPYNTSSHNLRC